MITATSSPLTTTHMMLEMKTAAMPRLAANLNRISPSLSPAVYTGLMRIAEGSLITASGYLIAAFYVPDEVTTTWQYVLAPMVAALAAMAFFSALKLYTVPALASAMRQLPRLALGWSSALAIILVAFFFLKIGIEFSRVWLALWFGLGLALLTALRFGVEAVTRRALADGRLVRRAVIYGGGAQCEALIRQLEADPGSDVRIFGVFDDRNRDRVAADIAGYPNLGTSEDLIAFGRKIPIDLLILALPMAAETRLNTLVNRLWVLPVDVKLPALASNLKFRPRAYSHIGSVAMLDLHDKPMDGWGTIVKTVFDKTIAALAIVALAPVMALIALAIKLESKGPVLFRQNRYGFNNELIEVLKFRSMFMDKSDQAAAKLVTKNDPRVTRVGRFIRKTSLDELPQLFNVLSGSLSLVGPRPHAVQAKAADKLYPDVVDGYFARHKVKPGITGWAQINGWRGETDTPEKIQGRVACDLYYIENWSPLFDAYILLRTPLALFRTENAY